MTPRAVSPHEFFDTRARRYDRTFAPSAADTRTALEPLFRNARVGGVALDVGCGTGRAWPPLQAVGLRVVGFDVSLPMLRQAETRSSCAGVLRVVGDVYDPSGWPFADASCDAVLALHSVFAHPPEAALGGDSWRDRFRRIGAEIRRICRAGAIVVIDVPEPSWARRALTPLGDDRYAWDFGDGVSIVALVPPVAEVVDAFGLPLELSVGEVGTRAIARV